MNTDVVILNVLLYGILPLWVVIGFLDYLCHRTTRIEENTGLRESALHAIMGLQVGAAIFIGFFLEITIPVFLLLLSILILHEVVAHLDVKTALGCRTISIWEMHLHSFLEVIPFLLFLLVAILKWPTLVDLITLQWNSEWRIKVSPLGTSYILSYFFFMLGLGILPYLEELFRCLRVHRMRVRP